MIPLCDAIPSRTRPGAVFGIAALSAAASVLAWWAAGAEAPHGLAPGTWQWLGLPASLVVNGDGLTLAVNLLALWLFGATVEDRLGHDRFVLLWVCSGLAAALVHVAVEPLGSAWLLGAAGATAGTVAAGLALHPQGRILGATPIVIGFDFVDVPSWVYAVTWAAVVLVTTPTASVAAVAAASGAGAAAGVAGALVLRRPERLRVEWWGA